MTLDICGVVIEERIKTHEIRRRIHLANKSYYSVLTHEVETHTQKDEAPCV